MDLGAGLPGVRLLSTPLHLENPAKAKHPCKLSHIWLALAILVDVLN